MIWHLSAAIAFLLASCCASADVARCGEMLKFMSLDPDHHVEVGGTLVVPQVAAGRVPAVVIVHSTGGVDGTGQLYRDQLDAAGIATFEVDFKTGVFHSSMDRPEPDTFLPMGFAALKLLRANPAIDPDRIGILGFSLGGILAIDSMIESNRHRWLGSEKGFAAFAALYPACRYFIRRLRGEPLQQAPLVVFYGSLDTYGAAEFCPKLESYLNERLNPPATFIMYPDVGHGFDRPGRPMSYDDPAAVNGRGHIEFNEAAATDARSKTLAFFQRWLIDAGRQAP